MSFACSSSVSVGVKAHCDLAVLDAEIYGVNPTLDIRNPMSPVIELRARIIQVRDLSPGSWIGKRPKRLAFVCSDGYPLLGGASDTKSQAIVDGQLCRIEGRASMHLLASRAGFIASTMSAEEFETFDRLGKTGSIHVR